MRNAPDPLAAAGLIKTGRVFDLSLELSPEIPHHPAHPPFSFTMARLHNDTVYESGVSSAVELISMSGHTGTHIDALGHFSSNGSLHGGLPVDQNQDKRLGLKVLGIETVPPIVGRGVLLDIPKLLGKSRLDNGYPITADDLQRAAETQGVDVKAGDVVLIRTGWAQLAGDARAFIATKAGLPGVDLSGADWLIERDIVAAGNDTAQFECTPSPAMPVHRRFLVEAGVYILENLNLEQLAEAACYEFFFCCLPLRIKGGTGSPVRPVAIV